MKLWSNILRRVILMNKENQLLLERITINPDVMVGKPTIRGLRITVEQVLKALSGGLTQNDLLEDYPELEPKDIQAALLYAVERVGEERVFKIDTEV
jgi:uncharacterized protein (DUF433 family)